jgi:hypothetical protein
LVREGVVFQTFFSYVYVSYWGLNPVFSTLLKKLFIFCDSSSKRKEAKPQFHSLLDVGSFDLATFPPLFQLTEWHTKKKKGVS